MPQVSHFIYIVQLQNSGLLSSTIKKTSLMSVDGYTDLEAQDMSLRVLSLLCFFSEIIVVVFPLKPMGIAKFSGSF